MAVDCAAESNKLAIPLDLPEEYVLKMRLSRVEGGKSNSECLFVGLPIGQSEISIGIDTGQTVSGIDLDGIEVLKSPHSYRAGPAIPQSGSTELVFVARKTGVQVICGGTTIINWTGDPRRGTVPLVCITPGYRLTLGSWHQGFLFDKLELEPLPATDAPAIPDVGSDGSIMTIINTDRDARLGEWKLDDGNLACRYVPYSRMQIPVEVPRQYVFSLKAERKQGNEDVIIGLPVNGHACAILIDGEHGHQAGIEMLDELRYFERGNLGHRRYPEPLLPTNKSVEIRCLVLTDTIIVTCGDKEVVRWHGDSRRLSPNLGLIPPNYSDADRQHLWLGAWYSEFAFRDLKLRPLSDVEAEELSKSFSEVFPTTSQSTVPLTAGAAMPLPGANRK
jgi:hypothetical protein